MSRQRTRPGDSPDRSGNSNLLQGTAQGIACIVGRAARVSRVGALALSCLLLAVAIVSEAQAGWPEGALPFLAAVVTTVSWLVTGAVATRARPPMAIGSLLLFSGLSLALDGALTSVAEVI